MITPKIETRYQKRIFFLSHIDGKGKFLYLVVIIEFVGRVVREYLTS